MVQPQTNSYKPRGYVVFLNKPGFDTIGSQFDIMRPFAGCRLCGALYQSDLDRAPYPLWGPLAEKARYRRNRWRELHTRRYHTNSEVEAFKKTDRAFTPEAQYKLEPFGIVAPFDIEFDGNEHALLTAPRIPTDDVEGT